MKEYINELRKCILFKNISETDIIPLLGCIKGKVHSY